MTAPRIARVATAIAGIGLALAACGAVDPAGATPYTPPPAALQDRVDCATPSEWRPGYGPTDPPAQLMGSVPAGFKPVDVVRCGPPQPHSAEAGQPVVVPLAEDHLAGDYGPLLAALAEPGDRAAAVSCLDWAEGPLQLWLVNAAGKSVHVMWALEACDKSKPATNEALAALHVASRNEITAGLQEPQPPKTAPAPTPESP